MQDELLRNKTKAYRKIYVLSAVPATVALENTPTCLSSSWIRVPSTPTEPPATPAIHSFAECNVSGLIALSGATFLLRRPLLCAEGGIARGALQQAPLPLTDVEQRASKHMRKQGPDVALPHFSRQGSQRVTTIRRLAAFTHSSRKPLCPFVRAVTKQQYRNNLLLLYLRNEATMWTTTVCYFTTWTLF